jgi:hypothetical protein
MTTWKKMDSAPKNKPILVKQPRAFSSRTKYDYHVVSWYDDDWQVSNGQDEEPLLGLLPDTWKWKEIPI